MILIYSEEITPRIEYICHLIFTRLLKTEVAFTENSKEFRKTEGPKLNYSFEKFDKEFYIKPHRLIQQKALITPNIQPVWFEGAKYFCESSQDSDLPFDPLAASFYLLSRFEEYTEKGRDKLGRFQPANSILYKYKLLDKPVVNIWAQVLGKKLSEKYPEFKSGENKFEYLSTIDIDNAWAYLHKGFLRSSGSLIHSLFKNRREFTERIGVLRGKTSDPYDTYDYLDKIYEGREQGVKFFFLVGDWSPYDKNVSHLNKAFRQLVRRTRKKYDIGLHPSFSSSKTGGSKKIRTERQRLEKIMGSGIEKSRQHFLRLEFPKTYHRLLKNGISSDYTMGYSCLPGFRAGICTPYPFYDLEREQATELMIVPFQVMDGTLRHYMKLSPEAALQEIKKLMQEVKNVGGTFVSIWHNETVNDRGLWEGYRQVFEEMNRLGFEWAGSETRSNRLHEVHA